MCDCIACVLHYSGRIIPEELDRALEAADKEVSWFFEIVMLWLDLVLDMYEAMTF